MLGRSDHDEATPGADKTVLVERLVTTWSCLWVVLLSWVVGGRLWWTQALGAALGVAALAVAISIPQNRRQLFRFPVFWLGLAFLLIILCQALNPWLRAVETRPGIFFWQLYALKYVHWLPAGIRADYAEMDTWRTLVYWLSPWLFVCAWWSAVRRRRAWHALAWTAYVNGLVIALLILLQSRLRPAELLWMYIDPEMSSNDTRFAGFSSRNPAGMYMYLAMTAGFALACHVYTRARIEGRDSGATWGVLLGCLVILGTFFVLGGRAVLVIGACIFLVGLIAVFFNSFATGGPSPGLWAGISILGLGLASFVIVQFTGKSSWTITRWIYVSAHPGEVDDRAVLRRVTTRMIEDYPWLGQGGGSYRYVSPDYFRAFNVYGSSVHYGGLSKRQNYAHSDWLQFPMEYGLVGALFPLAILLYLYGTALRLARWLGPPGAMALFGTVMLLVHATGDFPSYNAAVFMLFSLLLVATVKTASLEARQAAAKYVD